MIKMCITNCLFLTIVFSCKASGTIVNDETEKKEEKKIVWDKSTLQKIAPREGRQLNYAGYPRIKALGDGKIVAVYEADGNVEIIQTTDKGKSWSSPKVVFSSFEYNDGSLKTRVNMSNPEFIALKNGDWLMACNYRPAKAEITPFSIAIRKSTDQGVTWKDIEIIYEAHPRFSDGCWEPALLQLPNNDIHVYFANEKPYTNSDEQEISYLKSTDNGATWGEVVMVSFRPNRRDGMPVPLVVGNEILVAIEDNKQEQFKPYIVRTSLQNPWSTPVIADVKQRNSALRQSLPDDTYAGAPYIMKLPTGEVLMSYQTTRNRTKDWEKSTMDVAIGDKEGRNFTILDQPFQVPLEREAKWGSIALWDKNTVVATAASNLDGGSIAVWMILGTIK